MLWLLLLFASLTLTLSETGALLQTIELRSASGQADALTWVQFNNHPEYFIISTNCASNSSCQTIAPSVFSMLNHSRVYYLNQGSSIKGYCFFKHNSKQVQLSIKTVIEFLNTISDLTLLNVRFQDHFTIQLRFQGNSNLWLPHFMNIFYLHPNVLTTHANRISTMQIVNFTTHSHLKTASADTANRKLLGSGLHQRINLTIYLSEMTDFKIIPNQCRVIVKEILPESTYIDFDQLRNVKKYELINVETPEHLSKQYYYEYSIHFSDLQATGVRQYSYSYPIHFRYAAPSQLNYTKVYLHPVQSIRIGCQNSQFGVEVTENEWYDRGEAKIPTGAAKDAKVVSVITFISMLVAAMIIVKFLRKD